MSEPYELIGATSSTHTHTHADVVRHEYDITHTLLQPAEMHQSINQNQSHQFYYMMHDPKESTGQTIEMLTPVEASSSQHLALEAVKQELEIGPVMLQPTDMFYYMHEPKPEPLEEPLMLAEHMSAAPGGSAVKLELHDMAPVASQRVQYADYVQHHNMPQEPAPVSTASATSSGVHFLNINRNSTVSCSQCGKLFLTPAEFDNHFGAECSLTVACKQCGKMFLSPMEFERHFGPECSRNNGNRTYECFDCNRLFPSTATLIRHRKIHGEQSLDCPDCGKEFPRQALLAKHRLSHTNQRLHQCTTCEKSYNLMSSLRRHMETHNGEKPFQCPECDKKFAKQSLLRDHRRIHTGERPHACNLCERKFTKSSDLKRHGRVHTGEKPFVCSDCGRKFSNSSSLASHKNIHLGIKPHQCQYCDKKFLQPSDLKRHEKTHDIERLKEKYVCAICGLRFTNRPLLMKHSEIHAT